MGNVGGNGAKVRSKPHSGQRINSPRRLASSASGSMRALGHRRESLGVSGCKGGDSESEERKEISANCHRTTRVVDKIKEIEQVVIMAKHCETCAGLPAWISPLSVRPVSPPSAIRIRADDVCVSRLLSCRCNGWLQEIPTANPTLSLRSDICAQGHWATRLAPCRTRDRSGVVV